LKAGGFLLLVLIAMGAITALAQTTSSCFPHCHQCEVITGDIASNRILKKVEFSPLTGEEELTNKVFGIPGTNLMVTASVFYTDESMASQAGLDSMKLALAVSKRSWPDAFRSPNNAIAEITLASFDTARVQTNVRSGARRLLVSMECKETSSK
jgi:hypothetical protein